MTSLLTARDLAIAGRLRPTSVTATAGELVGIIGPNGGGKTSLLRALAGIEGTGTVQIDGHALDTAMPAQRARLLSYLPASREVVWPISVRDLVGLGLQSPDPQRVEELLDRLELQSLAERRVDRLSTGERARVLLARALVARPRVLLLDEPLSNLDPYWVLSLLHMFRQIAEQEEALLMVSLHDIDRITAFDRVLLLGHGEVRADLPPEPMLASAELASTFRIARSAGGWQVRPRAGPRSSR